MERREYCNGLAYVARLTAILILYRAPTLANSNLAVRGTGYFVIASDRYLWCVYIGSYEELMLGVKGKGKGKRGRVSKKGGSKVDIDEVMELGYGRHYRLAA